MGRIFGRGLVFMLDLSEIIVHRKFCKCPCALQDPENIVCKVNPEICMYRDRCDNEVNIEMNIKDEEASTDLEISCIKF